MLVGGSGFGADVPLRSLVFDPLPEPADPLSNGSLPAPVQETALGWDALLKEATLKPDETKGVFRFVLTNISSAPVDIVSTRSSCGCTVARLPTLPWRIGPGEQGSLGVEIDMRGKVGVFTKTVRVNTSVGYRYLTVRLLAPPRPPAPEPILSERERNQRLATADRQAIFRGDCASCHLAPGDGKAGRDLYLAVCGVCHEAEHRASMVPDLRTSGRSQPADYWRVWIYQGKGDSLMPGWDEIEGGPLSRDRIETLVEYLMGPFQHESPGAFGSNVTK